MERLRHIREQAGYSQQDLADESGVSQHTISEIELGRRKPQGRTLRKIARVLGVRVTDLTQPLTAGTSVELQWRVFATFEEAARNIFEGVQSAEERRAVAEQMKASIDRFARAS